MVSTTTTTKSYNEDRTEKLGITLPVKLLQKIDNIRGDVPRSKFIRRATESYLKGRWSKNGN
jgi:metal-responsive CopG/Arc/MetJ family transcriptional regulator